MSLYPLSALFIKKMLKFHFNDTEYSILFCPVVLKGYIKILCDINMYFYYTIVKGDLILCQKSKGVIWENLI